MVRPRPYLNSTSDTHSENLGFLLTTSARPSRPLNLTPSSSALGSIVDPSAYVVRNLPVASNCSRAMPMGSNAEWQAAHDGFLRCSSSATRTFFEGSRPLAARSGTTSAGGSGGLEHKRLRRIHLPRNVGDVRSPSDESARKPPNPANPRRLSVLISICWKPGA